MTPKSEFERQLAMLRSVKTIAVVGMSPDARRPSNEVGLYLREKGYTIIPIHPTAEKIGDLKVYPSLRSAADACGAIDLVDLFVAGERTRPVIEEAVALNLRRIWFQPGAENAESEAWAKSQGLDVVSGACVMAVLERGAQ
ncbi:MAG: CoA-binding protein [Candidatus Riflebacteria bacterium]|nr:CoA-binding protein [Candidatus Riflebacteria bacterium]